MPSTRNQAAIHIAAALKPAEVSADQTTLLIAECFVTVLRSGAMAKVKPQEVALVSRLVSEASRHALDCQEKLIEAHEAFVQLAERYVRITADDFGPDCLPMPKETGDGRLRIAA